MSKKTQLNSQISSFNKHISMYKNTNHLFLAHLSIFFLISANFGFVAGVSSGKNSGDNAKLSPSHAAIKTFCSSTLYPELCFSAIVSEAGVTLKVPTQKDVIESLLFLTSKTVKQINITVGKLMNTKGLSVRGNFVLHDCLETIDETLDELQKTMDDLKVYPSKKSLYQHADVLKTLVSSTITNQDTCLNGFNEDEDDKNVKAALQGLSTMKHRHRHETHTTHTYTHKSLINMRQKTLNL